MAQENPSLKHITDISPYFKYDEKKHTMTFIGDTLEIRIPKRFDAYGLLNITDVVECLGIMDLIIDGTYNAHLHLLALLTVEPSEVSVKMIEGQEYQILTLYNGDRFISNTVVVKNQSIVYALYVEFITRGNIIYTMGYQDLIWLFDSVKQMCDTSLPVDHAIFEMLYAHLARDGQDKFKQYRHTDMKAPFEFVGLKSVSFAPDSTTARLLGAYYADGEMASLLHTNEDRQVFEDLLRGVPLEEKEDRTL